MTDAVSWVVEFRIRPGTLPEVRALTSALVHTARDELGASAFQCFISADGSVLHAIERYENSEAALEHLEPSHGFAVMQSVCETHRCWVYGVPSVQLRAALVALKPLYMTEQWGFAPPA
jgi:quinol monooxygenase YgiN